MGGQPESGERYYALESLRTAQVRIMELTQQMAVQRVQVEACKDSDIAAARDLYSQLQSTRTQLADTLSEARFPLLEAEEYQMAAVAGQLREGLLRFNLMSTATVPSTTPCDPLPANSPWRGPPAPQFLEGL